MRQVPLEPLIRRLFRDVLLGHPPAAALQSGSVVDDQPHGCEDPAPARTTLHLASDQHALVGIEMKHTAAGLEVGLRQFDGTPFHHGIADRVGMSQSLAFDDFYSLVGEGWSIRRHDQRIDHSLTAPFA
jgi:hypothetical protein